jgi:cation diffusion facilitator CzcD-associated flavoprotein CzcO
MTNHTSESFRDVIIVGAGISGINTAHHIQEKLPDLIYSILEARSNIGGTWDLFRYPGIRSDTDLHTFGFPWSPWSENRAIADGGSIVRYLSQSAKDRGIDRNILFRHRVISANWCSGKALWQLDVEIEEDDHTRVIQLQARFLVLGTGYYDYTEGLQPDIPGLSSQFKGTVAHPQFWPEDLDYANKRVVIIGSGATAITLLPNIAKKAAHVTMVQRSPTYIMSMNNKTGGSLRHKVLPRSWSFKIDRWIFMWAIVFLYQACRLFPDWSRKRLQTAVEKQLPDHIPVDPHFVPRYKPWDQRLCFSPNGDFFESLWTGKAHVETDQIRCVTDRAVVLQESGKHLEADIIVPATGLKLAIGGRIEISVDGARVDLADRYAWHSALLQDVPNLAFMMGYINASWTLGTETTCQILCRLLRYMKSNEYTAAIPRVPAGSGMQPRLMWNLDSTYVKKASAQLPRCGNVGPWKGRVNYFVDLWKAKYGSVTQDVEFRTVTSKME